jgi:tetratricopeptide (TPR) repeat protein
MKKIMLVALLSCLMLISFAQDTPCGFMYGKIEKDSLKCLEEISLFRNSYNQQNYLDAYPHWKTIVALCPCSWSAIFNTVYLQNIFRALIASTNDEIIKNQYIDELLKAVEERHQYFPRNYTEGNGLGFKAFYMMSYRANTNQDIENAFNLFIESIEMEREKTQPNIWDIYFKIAEQMAIAKKDTTIMIDAYERATDYIEMAVNNFWKDIDKQIPNFENLEEAFANGQLTQADYENRKQRLIQDTARSMSFISNYEKTLKNIEIRFTPFAPCHVLELVYQNKLEQTKDNLDKLKKMLITMSKGGCINSTVFVEMLNIVHKAEPGAQTANLMGYYSLNHGDYDAALKFFKEAIELFETNEQKVNPWYMIGLVYQIKDNYPAARSAALEALKLKPNFGKAYILIGDLYAASGNKCRTEDGLPLDYNWVAADRYARGAAVDASVAELAREKRNKLSFPTELDKFQRGLKEGNEYRVGCWIQETTTVK